MKAICKVAIVVFVVLFPCCKRDPEPEMGWSARISCANQQTFLLTQRGVLSFHDFNLGDVVVYNTDDHSLNTITSIKKHIVLKERVQSEVIDTQSVAFDRIANIEVEGNLDVATKAAVESEVEKNISRSFSLDIRELWREELPSLYDVMETDQTLMHRLSNGPFEETRIDSNLILLVVDKVYYCKRVFVSDSLNRKVNVGGQVSVVNSKVLKGKVNVVIENSCNSLLEANSVKPFKLIYSMRPFSFNKHYFMFTPIARTVFK